MQEENKIKNMSLVGQALPDMEIEIYHKDEIKKVRIKDFKWSF